MELLDREVRKRILLEITPTKEEIAHQQRVVEILTEALVERAEAIGQGYDFIEAHGSTGQKQTQLRGAADIDLFVGLDPSDFAETLHLPVAMREKRITQQFEELVDKWFIPAAKQAGATNVLKSFSQHPYLSVEIEETEVDVIACFNIDSSTIIHDGPITAVDRTLHHTRYVCSNINERLREDIRILKSFIRASHAYGDNCAVGRMGFTGYSIELLVLQGRGLANAVKMLLNLETQPIDPLGRSLSILKKHPAFRDDYVIIIDPTDKNRNVASSFSPRSVRWVMKRLSHFQEINRIGAADEIVKLFLEKPIPIDPLPAWVEPHVITREFQSDGTAHYTMFRDKLYRLCRRIEKRLQKEWTGEKRFGEILYEVYFEGQHFAVGFVVEQPKISQYYTRRGPPAHLSEAAKAFKKKHRNAYEQDGFLWVNVKRRYTSVNEMIDAILQKEQIEGLRSTERGLVSARLCNTLYRYVMRVESNFILSKREEYKEMLHSLEW